MQKQVPHNQMRLKPTTTRKITVEILQKLQLIINKMLLQLNKLVALPEQDLLMRSLQQSSKESMRELSKITRMPTTKLRFVKK